MTHERDETALFFPFAEPPKHGRVTQIRPDVLWARMPLPFRLDHVNIYFLKEGDGWAALDTGIDDARTREIWETLLSGPLAGQRLTRVIVSHHHPDHIGLAGWLCARFGIPMLTSQSAYLGCMTTSINPEILAGQHCRKFYARHGMDAETTKRVCSGGHRYLEKVSPLPPTFSRVVFGDDLTIGQRSFEVMTFDGHSNEQVVLYCAAENLLLAGDQVIAKISSNVSVQAQDPEGDPLGLFLRSLETLTRRISGDALVLPGHQLPFFGLHARCRELARHHADRCARIEAACRERPHSVAELVPVLFTRILDPQQLSFAFSEAHAHVNRLLRSNGMTQSLHGDGIVRFSSIGVHDRGRTAAA